VCVGLVVRATEFEPSFLVIFFVCVCAPADPHEKRELWRSGKSFSSRSLLYSRKENIQQMITEPTQPNNKHVIKGLGADGPDPNIREKLMLFGSLWEIGTLWKPATHNLTEPRSNERERYTSDGFLMEGRYRMSG
jgi:hypothetical protein